MTSHQITVHYTLPLLKKASLKYLIKATDKKLFILCGVGAFLQLCSIILSKANNPNLPEDILTLLALIISPFALIGIVYLKQVPLLKKQFTSLNNQPVHFNLSEKNIVIKKPNVESIEEWTTFKQLMCFKEFWLLVNNQDKFYTLPVEQLSPELKDLIKLKMGDRVKA